MGNRVGLLWYASGEGENEPAEIGRGDRLAPLSAAIARQGLDPAPIPYRHDNHEAVAQLLEDCSAVMVWVNPVEEGRDRRRLDSLLHDLERTGIVVSASHAARLRIGTKAVIHTTRHMSWGTDSYLYRNRNELTEAFPSRLRSSGPRVLKQERGHSGNGVWKVEAIEPSLVRVTNAGTDEVDERSLRSFLDEWTEHFTAEGVVVDQPFLPLVSEGMIRCYMSGAQVLGLIHQLPKAGGLNVSRSGLKRTDGLTGDSYYYPAESTPHPALVEQLDVSWIDELCEAVKLDKAELPALWDIDFIAAGQGRYALCEINVNSVSPPPGGPVDVIATTLARRLKR